MPRARRTPRPGNSNSGQSVQQISCRLCAEEARLREVAAEKVEDGAGVRTNRRGQASKDREGLKSGMSRQPK